MTVKYNMVTINIKIIYLFFRMFIEMKLLKSYQHQS